MAHNSPTGSSKKDSVDPRAVRIMEIIEDVIRRRKAGEAMPNEKVIADHPDLAPDLAEMLHSVRDLSPQPTIPGYCILRMMKRGGQAVVYEAIRLTTGMHVALKVILQGAHASPEERARIQREARILGALDHRHVVQVIDCDRTPDDFLYLVTRYIPGWSLDEYLNLRRDQTKTAGRDPDPAEFLQLFLKVCDAVHVVHLRGIVHRDLKPSNIRVDKEGEPHVLDFGLARTGVPDLTDESNPQPVTLTCMFLGSLAYASPEQAEGIQAKIDCRSDVYSLGVILYEMLTGTFPYNVKGSMPEVLHNILTADPTPPSKVLAAKQAGRARATARKLWHIRRTAQDESINPQIEAIVLKALAKTREQRYQTAGDLAQDIRNYLAGRPTSARRATSWLRWPRPAVTASAAAVLLAVGVVAIVMASRNDPGEGGGTIGDPGEPGAPGVPTVAPEVRTNANRISMQQQSLTNLRTIMMAMMLYSADNRDLYPPDVGILVRHRYLNPSFVLSPFEGKKLPAGLLEWTEPRRQEWANGNCSYILLTAGKRHTGDYDKVVAFEKFSDKREGTAVVFDDGTLRWMGTAEARSLIEKQTGKPIADLSKPQPR